VKIDRPGSTAGFPLRADGARSDPDGPDARREALRKASREFEGIFLSHLLKGMGKSPGGDGLFGSGAGAGIYSDMFYGTVADQVAVGGGLGLSDLLYESLVGRMEDAASEADAAAREVDTDITSLERVPSRSRRPVAPSRPRAEGPLPESVRRLRRYDGIVRSAARRHGLDADLLRAVILQESGADPRAVSDRGARGLMQLMDGTARELGVRDVFDPRENIEGGASYLRGLLDRFGGDLPRALAAFNAGPSAVERHGGIPPFKETREFVVSVLRNLSMFRKEAW
jgi:Rod binding domain-containing protein